jgi:hypothetical protein
MEVFLLKKCNDFFKNKSTIEFLKETENKLLTNGHNSPYLKKNKY